MFASTKEAGLQTRPAALNCNIIVAVCQCVAVNDAPRLRNQIASAYPGVLSASVLKQCDEQNLPALLALKQALDQANLKAEQCSNWGLIAVPKMPGRRRIAESLNRFHEQGAWSTSPHLIPNSSLHSPSGLYSQALQLHGPNFGAGGMTGSEGEGLIAAVTLLEGEKLPGVWLIFTGWERESLDPADVRCRVAVLGIQSTSWAPERHRVSFTASLDTPPAPAFSFASLCESIRLHRDSKWDVGGMTCAISCSEAHLEAAA